MHVLYILEAVIKSLRAVFNSVMYGMHSACLCLKDTVSGLEMVIHQFYLQKEETDRQNLRRGSKLMCQMHAWYNFMIQLYKHF